MTERGDTKISGTSFLALACVGFVSSAMGSTPAQAQSAPDPENADKADPAAARRLKGEVLPITIPGEKRSLFGKIFGRKAA